MPTIQMSATAQQSRVFGVRLKQDIFRCKATKGDEVFTLALQQRSGWHLETCATPCTTRLVTWRQQPSVKSQGCLSQLKSLFLSLFNPVSLSVLQLFGFLRLKSCRKCLNV